MATPPDDKATRESREDRGDPDRLTQTQYAKRRGWSKQYVNQLVKQGRITLIDGKIDPIAAGAALDRDRDPTRQADYRTDGMLPASPVVGTQQDASARIQGSFVKARTVREHFKALRERMDYEQAAGRLVDKQEVEDASFEAGMAVRECFAEAAREIGTTVAEGFSIDRLRATKIATEIVDQTLVSVTERFKQLAARFDQETPGK